MQGQPGKENTIYADIFNFTWSSQSNSASLSWDDTRHLCKFDPVSADDLLAFNW